MNNEVPHILSFFDDSDFKDFDMELWKSKYYSGTIVIYYDNKYISIEKIFTITASGKKVQLTDMKNF